MILEARSFTATTAEEALLSDRKSRMSKASAQEWAAHGRISITTATRMSTSQACGKQPAKGSLGKRSSTRMLPIEYESCINGTRAAMLFIAIKAMEPFKMLDRKSTRLN